MKNSELEQRTQKAFTSLKIFSAQHVPVIEVPDRVFLTGNGAEERDPALAVLFKRIGTGGTPLSNADYVFSVLKHRNPGCHSLVERLLANERVAALFTPVTLVTAAVRLAAARLRLSDYARIDKAQFSRLLQEAEFLSTFNDSIKDGGQFSLCLVRLLETLSYHKQSEGDIGLPKQALCLLDLPVLETLLCWLQKQSDRGEVLLKERRRLIRFSLYCALAVQDPHKASTLMFEHLKVNDHPEFPEEGLTQVLVDKQLALPMRSPEWFRDHSDLWRMVTTPSECRGLRGWRRFSLPDLTHGNTYNEEERKVVEQGVRLYRRFWNRKQRWNYRHELLLWLQRDYVYRIFEESPAWPTAEDETPYDYDHICPQSHWSSWTGIAGTNRIIDFLEFPNEIGDQPQSWLGDSIGNLRVWDSSDNRADSDAPPADKLGIAENAVNTNRENCMADSVVDDARERVDDWRACSPEQPNNPRDWTESRTMAFQRAIENRVFYLYQRLYQDLAPWPDSDQEALARSD